MIIVNKKPNITHLPYKQDNRSAVFSFVPGQNTIDAQAWQAIKKEAGEKRMAHYSSFLKPIGEEAAEQQIDPSKLNAEEFIDLIGGAMSLDILSAYAEAENSRKGGPRKTVLEAIERQAAEINEIELKKKEK